MAAPQYYPTFLPDRSPAGAAASLAATATAAPGQRVLRTPEYRELQKRVAHGWNTWNTTSVLSHAHLPEGFAITLGLKNSGTGIPTSASSSRPTRP
jgi:hypothetical protein